MRFIHTIEIKDEGTVGAARRAVHRFASEANFAETELAELDIVVQEIGTNALRYATDGGTLHFAHPHFTHPSATESEKFGIELFYWDKGPGISDTEAATRDAYSTSGSLGGGLGAIRRLTDEFDIYSTVRGATGRLTLANGRRTTHGTALLCRKQSKSFPPRTLDADEHTTTKTLHRIGAWSRARFGEEANGDAYFVRELEGQTLLAVVDGLGHGPGAHEAARAALDVLKDWNGEPLDELVHAAHAALRGTRGAVMGLASVDRARKHLHYTGVGNTSVRVMNAPQPTHPISANGTLGARLGKVPVWTYAWSPETIIVMASDGVSSRWDVTAYPGLLDKQPQMIAGVLVRDYGRTSDDATILVTR